MEPIINLLYIIAGAFGALLKGVAYTAAVFIFGGHYERT